MARAALDDWLAQGTQTASTEENARLLVTELVSNAIRHAHIEADEPLRVRAWMQDTTLHIEVWDAGADGTVVAGPPRRFAAARSGGFGLNLVALLSSDWGVDRDAHGTTVWLELAMAPGSG